MNCDITTYRIRVGLYNQRMSPKSTNRTSKVQGKTRSPCNLAYIFVIAMLLLTLGCDIHLNPGPTEDPTINSSSSEESNLSTTSTEFKPSSNHLNFLHINAESIRKKMDSMAAEAAGYDIIGVSETWLNPDITNDKVSIPGYTAPYRKDRQDSHGGVALYVKDNLISKEIKDITVDGLEGLWVQVSHANFKCVVGVMYRPPNSKTEYWKKINESIESVKNKGFKNLFLMGDLNCNLLIKDSKLDQLLQKYHFTQLIKQPTHTKPNSSTLIDIIATTCPDYVYRSGVTCPNLSNHNPVYACLKLRKPKTNCFKRKIWVMKDINWDQINENLRNTDWSIAFTKSTINEIATEWTNIYTTVLENSIKRKTITVRPNDAEWITPEIRKAIRQRKRIHSRAKKRNKQEDWEKFRSKRNEVIRLIKEAKDKHTENQIRFINSSENKSSNPKTWWKLVKEFYKSNCSSNNLNQPLVVNGKSISNNYEKANALNEYFVKQSQLDADSSTLPIPNPLTQESLTTISINASEVKEILSTLDTTKACGHDGITPKMLKMTASTIAPSLAMLFNYSLRTKSFPDIWKLAHVSPLFKKGDPTDRKNYRPISLLCILGKVFERIIFKYIFNFLINNNKISKVQAAYTPGSSTEYQLLEIYHSIVSAMDDRKLVRYVFCDCSKAFDRVWHDGLLFKLNDIGIRGSLHEWLRSYLSNRTQKVVVKGEQSEPLKLEAGVPQGSILGPLLFIIYINDLADQVSSNIRIYADDSSIFATGNNEQELSSRLNQDLENISAWAKKWHITFNPEKTETLSFSMGQQRNLTPLRMSGQIINEVSSHKHLGCILQRNGKWKEHIQDIAAKCGKRVDVLRGLKYKFDRKTLEILYNAYIRPCLEYASSTWSNCSLEQKKQIEEIQLSAARVVTGAIRGTSHSKIYKETKWINTYHMRYRKNMTTYYKMYHRQAPTYLTSIMPSKVREKTNYNLRNKHDIAITNDRTTLMQNSFLPNTTRLWNSTADDIKYIGNLSEFKKHLKKNDERPPKFYYTGKRRGQILHTRIRMGCALKSQLFNMHIIDSELCDCGNGPETVLHYFEECPLYHDLRQELLRKYLGLTETGEHYTIGIEKASMKENTMLFKAITDYIEKTGRFQ